MLDGHLAQSVGRRDAPGAASRGGHRDLGDEDSHGEGRDERDGRVRRRERRSDLATFRQDADDEVRERPPCKEPESARKQGHEQRLAGDEAPDLARRRTERTQHGGLPPPLGDRQRERPGDHEQRDRAGDPAHRAEDRDEPRTVSGGRVACVGICGVPAIEDLGPAAETLRQSAAQRGRRRAGVCDDADRVDPAGGTGQRAGDRPREEDRSLTAVTGPARVGEAADAVPRLAGGRDDPQRRADARTEPGVGDDVLAACGRTACGQVVWRERGAVPSVTDQPVRAGSLQVVVLGVPCPCREGDVAHGARDSRHRGGARHRGLRQTGAGHDVDALGVLAVADGHGGVGADDGVGGGEAPGARRPERGGHEQAGRGGQRHGEPDRDERARQCGAACPQGLQGDAQHVRPPVRSGARRPARPSGRAARRRADRLP